MTPRRPARPITAVLCVALFALAFVAAPKSCEWGLAVYFWAGLAASIAALAAPLILERDRPLGGRILTGVGSAAVVLAVWIAGLFVANVRILCRLF